MQVLIQKTPTCVDVEIRICGGEIDDIIEKLTAPLVGDIDGDKGGESDVSLDRNRDGGGFLGAE